MLNNTTYNNLHNQIVDRVQKIFAPNSYKHLIISAGSGTGKTYLVRETLDTLNKEYAYLNGNLSLFSLYKKLWEVENSITCSVLVLDDVDLTDRGIVDVLKCACDPTAPYVQFNKILTEKNIPNSFVFNKHIIVISSIDVTKLISKNNMLSTSIQSLLNRSTLVKDDFLLPTPTTQRDIQKAYLKIFQSNEGMQVLEDLERIANQTKLDAENPNPNTAIWKCAQLSLIQRINNQILN